MEERSVQAQVDSEIYSTAYRELTERVSVIACEFNETGDFQRLVDEALAERARVLKDGMINPTHIPILVTDKLSLTEGGFGNESLVSESKKRETQPLENFLGPRLQAMSCLLQIFRKEDEKEAKERRGY
jgi:hypothetical protein